MPVVGPSRAICAFSGWLGRGDGIILSTLLGQQWYLAVLLPATAARMNSRRAFQVIPREVMVLVRRIAPP
jgi:hypothetical protein